MPAAEMKLPDLSELKGAFGGFPGIEKELQKRRFTSNWSLLLAAVSSVLSIAFALTPVLNLPISQTIAKQLRISGLTLFLVAFIFACIWILFRYTSFLFKESKEPFRYTFSINNFDAVKATPDARFTVDQMDQMGLLRFDLTERLNRRVRRFSFLEKPKNEQSGLISHFHIEGDYAIREEESDGWILHVWPRIRIGPEGNPFTLAYPVRLPILDGANPNECKTKGVLDLDEYQRLVERVYSSVATEIYKQIEIDLRGKMTLFPTNTLRALARYVEAEDFETSNTIDAYDRALEMYQSSLDELFASRWHEFVTWLGQRRFARWLVSLDSTRIRARMEAEAKTKIGYSRCLIYRKLVSETAGRKRNPIFKSREYLTDARDLLRQCYNCFLPKELQLISIESPEACAGITLARLAVPGRNEPSPRFDQRWTLHRKRSYQQVRDELCEAFAVGALAHSLLEDSNSAQRFRQLTDAFCEETTPARVRLLILLAKAELEPALEQRVVYLTEASQMNSDSEIALYRLAFYSDLLARDLDQITKEKVKYLNRKYEDVLKVNPANIASLIGQGYLFWLVDDLDQAAKKLRAGIELQKIVAQTFVGDLKYCLARVEVELVFRQLSKPDRSLAPFANAVRLLNLAAFDYEEATSAEPSVAAGAADVQANSRNTYYDRVNRRILARYRLFARRAGTIVQISREPEKITSQNSALAKPLSTVLSYALNDCGNACLNYYFRFEIGAGNDAALRKALRISEQSWKLENTNFMAEYNYFLTLREAADEQSQRLAEARSKSLLENSAKLPPQALVNVVTQVILQTRQTTESYTKKYDTNDPQALKKTKEIALTDLDQKLERLNRQKQQGAGTTHSPNISSQDRSGAPETSAGSAHREPAAKVETEVPARRSPISQGESGKTYADDPQDDPAKYQKDLESKREQNQKDLDEIADWIKQVRKLEDLEAPVRDFVREKTSLAPFADLLVTDRIGELLNKPIRWSDVGESEVFSLVSLATIWAVRLDAGAKVASRILCGHVIKEYSRDHFYLNWTLLELVDEKEEKERLISITGRIIDWSLKFDPKSRLFMAWNLSHLDQSAKIYCAGWPYEFSRVADYEKVIGKYQAAKESCSGLPIFHYRSAALYEYLAMQQPLNESRYENNRFALDERRTAYKLEPANPDYRDAWLKSAGRQLLSGNILEDRLKERPLPSVLEIEVAKQLVEDLGLTETGLPAEFQKQITDLRTVLKTTAGFVLPSVKFRDNASLGPNSFQFFLRGVPLPLEAFAPELQQPQKWIYLTRRIEEVARNQGAHFYSSQDCYWKLAEIGKERQISFADLQNDPLSLASLSWVLKSLLSERVPIADFYSIAKEFQRCQARNLDLVTTVEEIRSLPKIRRQLPGNSQQDGLAIKALSRDLANRIHAAVDKTGSEPIFKSSPGILRDIRLLALQVKTEAGATGSPVLVTPPPIRPFARKMVADMDINVLSTREIIPPLLSQLKDSDATVPKQLRAAAGA